MVRLGGGLTSTGSAQQGGSAQQAEQPSMTFIDFEYAEWAPRGFDLGNHFCE